MRPSSLLLPLGFFTLTLGCVPKKDHDALLAELDTARTELGAQLTERDGRIAALEADLAAQEALLAKTSAELTALQVRYDEETNALRQEKAELLKDRTRLRESVEEIKAALDELAARKVQAEARVAAYRDMLERFKALIDAGRLRVEIVDGRMVVVMATDILFESGKAELSVDGKAALFEVGEVLADIPDRAYQVEGHTDDDPIKTARFPSNWELGSTRALTVVRTLIEAGVTEDRVSAASFAEFRPVASNVEAAGKAANRRIEIVVVPDLSMLPGAEELAGLNAP